MDTLFPAIMSKFSEAFPPADENDYTMKLTTDELHSTFLKFYPVTVPLTDFFNVLLESGYKYIAEERQEAFRFTGCCVKTISFK